ncbi:MAG: hypothetical protein Greene07147_830 [Parcubacteria group bacterium Greene0714_7]|nr:MAG: hypothetical protein Greene07147_830 [Parcubacteria group bacterium Greene0714_7]
MEKIDYSLESRRKEKQFRCAVKGCTESPMVSIPRYEMKDGVLVAVPVLLCRMHAGPFRPS